MPDRERAAHGAAKPVMVLAIVAAIALGLWVVGSLLDVLLLCFSGLLFGLFLQGAGAWMARRTSLPRPVAVGAFCVVLVVLTGVLGWLAAPSVASQIDELTTTLPRALDKAAKPLERFSWVRAVLERAPHADDVLARRETWSRAGGAVSTALGGFGSLVVILFVGLFTAFDPDLYRRGFLRLLAMKGDEATSVRMDWARELANQLLGRIKNRLLCPRTAISGAQRVHLVRGRRLQGRADRWRCPRRGGVSTRRCRRLATTSATAAQRQMLAGIRTRGYSVKFTAFSRAIHR